MAWGSNLFPLLIITSGGGFTGLFVYSPHPGAGNLVASIASQAGTDPFGNAYPAGVTSYGATIEGIFNASTLSWQALSNPFNVEPSIAGIGNSLTGADLSLSSGAATPSSALARIDLEDQVHSGTASSLISIRAGQTDIGPVAGTKPYIFLFPSGDVTGATDTSLINGALALTGAVILGPGVFYTNAPISMTHDFQVLQGAGQPYATTIQSAATTPQTAMIVASGTTAPINAVTIRDLALKSSTTNSGHGIVFRSNNGLIQNVNVQGAPGGDCFHLSLDALTPVLIFDITMINCYALQPGSAFNGYLIDGNYNSCELILCRGQGGTGPSSPGALWGIQCLAGGSQIKLTDCHMFEFTNGGAVFLGTGYQVVGGEYETNGVGAGPGFGVGIRAGSTCLQLRVTNASMYGNNANDIQEQAGTDHNVYYGNTIESGTGVVLTGTHTIARDNQGYNPVGHLTAPTYTAGSPSTNTFGVVVTVYVTGSTAVAIDGVATGLATGTFQLEPGETITPTGAGGSWVWFGQ